MHRTTLVLALASFACEPPPAASPSDGAPTPTETPTSATPDAAKPVDPEVAAAATSDVEAQMNAAPPRTPGALKITPTKSGDGVLPTTPLSKGARTMMDHLAHFGWTADGQAFEHCAPAGGRGGWLCERHPMGGTAEKFDDAGKTGDVDKKKHKAIAARMKALVGNPTSWAWGEAVALVWQEKSGGARGKVEVGAQLVGNAGVTYPLEFVFDEDFIGHVEVVIPSPDGVTLAIVAHGFAGEFSDTFITKLVPADQLAAEAYNGAGLEALRTKDFAAAAKYFASVAALDPAWKGPFNLACAHARAGDGPRAEAALREAMARDATAVRKKAKGDPDLEGVRSEPWFAEVVG